MLTCLKTIHGNEEPNGGKKLIFYTLKSSKKMLYSWKWELHFYISTKIVDSLFKISAVEIRIGKCQTYISQRYSQPSSTFDWSNFDF